MSNQESRREPDHLEDLDCGAGCTEIWEHLSEQRRDDDGDDVD